MKSKLLLVLASPLLIICCKSIHNTISKSDMVSANITLKSESGASILDKGAMVTSETIGQYMPSKNTIQKAKRELKKAGFEVSANGIGLHISTSKENFEKVLQVKFLDETSEKKSVFKTEKKIEVPANWKAFVESIDLPEPVEYF
jgi:hypothetical protein